MDIKNKPITEQLQDALGYCKSRGYSILLTADTNSHSKLWGNETNTRGKKWEEIIETEHLLVHNQGRIPTFESKNGKSIIDVTLSHRLPYTLENWRVLRSYNGVRVCARARATAHTHSYMLHACRPELASTET